MKVKVDPDLCIGCTLCTQVCPDIFKMEGDKAIASVSVAPKDKEALCKQAADDCPVTAIILS